MSLLIFNESHNKTLKLDTVLEAQRGPPPSEHIGPSSLYRILGHAQGILKMRIPEAHTLQRLNNQSYKNVPGVGRVPSAPKGHHSLKAATADPPTGYDRVTTTKHGAIAAENELHESRIPVEGSSD
jgi:hypothetical protein